jgi:hypothetical protein
MISFEKPKGSGPTKGCGSVCGWPLARSPASYPQSPPAALAPVLKEVEGTGVAGQWESSALRECDVIMC